MTDWEKGGGEEPIERIANAAGMIVGVSGNRTWIEIVFEGDLMHTRAVDLPEDSIFDVYIEEVPHKATVCEYPRTMVFFRGPCDLEISREANRIMVRAAAPGGTNVA
jgi:hypothetical protein